ncbi:MAG: hypothetical protein WA066_06260 [Candidatus Omnitrophota bacterium]
MTKLIFLGNLCYILAKIFLRKDCGYKSGLEDVDLEKVEFHGNMAVFPFKNFNAKLNIGIESLTVLLAGK